MLRKIMAINLELIHTLLMFKGIPLEMLFLVELIIEKLKII